MSSPTATHYRDEQLFIEELSLADIAEAVGTPVYVYSKAYITQQITQLQAAFARTSLRIHYSVKANSNLAILTLLRDLGAGFDIVSSGELHRVLAAGGDSSTIVFSGVGKQVEEIDLALKLGIACFNVESEQELQRISTRAAIRGVAAPVSIRVNPNVDAQTHPYISTGLKKNKFGVPHDTAMAMYRQAHNDPNLTVSGIDCHIGSQITDISPLLASLSIILTMVDDLASEGIELDHIDLGGGMGVTYENETPLHFEDYGAGVSQLMAGRKQAIMLEPGRSIVANAGVLLTRIEYLKSGQVATDPRFAVVDAAMNDLIRPALYQAWHNISEVSLRAGVTPSQWQVVGPICESGDFLGHDRNLAISQGDLLCVNSAGAYGFVQASNYNSRNRAAEVLVDGDTFTVVRRRETIEDQIRLELQP